MGCIKPGFGLAMKEEKQMRDTRPFFHVYGDTPMSRGVVHAQYRTFEDAKRKADVLLDAAYILVQIRREEYDHEPGIEPERVVWAAATPEIDWR